MAKAKPATTEGRAAHFTTTIPANLLIRVKAIAKREMIPLSAVARRAIAQYVERTEGEACGPTSK